MDFISIVIAVGKDLRSRYKSIYAFSSSNLYHERLSWNCAIPLQASCLTGPPFPYLIPWHCASTQAMSSSSSRIMREILCPLWRGLVDLSMSCIARILARNLYLLFQTFKVGHWKASESLLSLRKLRTPFCAVFVRN